MALQVPAVAAAVDGAVVDGAAAAGAAVAAGAGAGKCDWAIRVGTQTINRPVTDRLI
jgi:hypothetical protein